VTAVLRSDALVFFGATGDLAHKMIFPALRALVRHGRLDIPAEADRIISRSGGWHQPRRLSERPQEVP
jgi:glucose-6-phosphate 1-dehydrogenase